MLPDVIQPRLVSLPWQTDIEGSLVTSVTVAWELEATRTYGGSQMEIGRYSNVGVSASPAMPCSVCVLCNVDSYEMDTQLLKDKLVWMLLRRYADFIIAYYVNESIPPGQKIARAVGYPLNPSIIGRVIDETGDLPVPPGSYAGFRLCAASEYASMSDFADVVRGGGPPPV